MTEENNLEIDELNQSDEQIILETPAKDEEGEIVPSDNEALIKTTKCENNEENEELKSTKKYLDLGSVFSKNEGLDSDPDRSMLRSPKERPTFIRSTKHSRKSSTTLNEEESSKTTSSTRRNSRNEDSSSYRSSRRHRRSRSRNNDRHNNNSLPPPQLMITSGNAALVSSTSTPPRQQQQENLHQNKPD
uniref:Uncharacterized protein n=1 Tax=Meloidogyne javanica TaxID=6303 RepID=A0A915LK91_MELJA